MSLKIQEIKKTYNNFKEIVNNKKSIRNALHQIQLQHQKVQEQINNAKKKKQLGYIKQLAFFKQQYQKVIAIINNSKINNYSINRQHQELSKVFNKKYNQLSTVSQQLNDSKSYPNSYIKEQSYRKSKEDKQNNKLTMSVMDFLIEKQKKISTIKSQKGFQSILEDVPLSKRNFKVKKQVQYGQTNVQKLQQLKQENFKLKATLSNLLQNKQIYNQQLIKNAKQHLSELQQKSRQLSENNQRVRQRTNKNKSHTDTIRQVVEIQGQYIFNIKSNNLQSIHYQNYNRKTSNHPKSYQNYQFSNQHLQKQEYRNPSQQQIKPYYQNRVYSERLWDNQENEKYQSNDIYNGANFQSYIKPKYLQKSPFVIRDAFLGIYDPNTCSRNKISFFKESMIIVNDRFCQIGFKKSQLNKKLDQLTIVFFITNKTNSTQVLNIAYKDESQSYKINVRENITSIQPRQQKKTIIDFTLKNYSQIDSVIDAIFQFTQISKTNKTIYQLWVPTNFIKFDYHYRKPEWQQIGFNSKAEGFVIRQFKADDQFKFYERSVEAGLPLSNKQQSLTQTNACLFGESKCYSGGVKITWKNNSKMVVKGSQKWVDWISFILCNYKAKK